MVQLWRKDMEYSETLEDVRQGSLDEASGLAEPAATAFSDIRWHWELPIETQRLHHSTSQAADWQFRSLVGTESIIDTGCTVAGAA